MKNDLTLAMMRWAVMCRQWHDIGGEFPVLGAFLAGWFWRDMGNELPKDCGTFQNSFRVGFREADTMLAIESQKTLAPTQRRTNQ